MKKIIKFWIFRDDFNQTKGFLHHFLENDVTRNVNILLLCLKKNLLTQIDKAKEQTS